MYVVRWNRGVGVPADASATDDVPMSDASEIPELSEI
jgi:hypothetical protein